MHRQSKKKNTQLSGLQRQFVEEYLVDLKAYPAAKRAGYSESYATKNAHKLLRLPQVQAYLAVRQGELQKRHQVTVDRVIQELAKLAFANLDDYSKLVGDDRVIDMSKATRDQLAAVRDFEVETFTRGQGKNREEGKRVKIKLSDKHAPLISLGKHLGIFKEAVELSGAVRATFVIEE